MDEILTQSFGRSTREAHSIEAKTGVFGPSGVAGLTNPTPDDSARF
jgi:hypothetical protein